MAAELEVPLAQDTLPGAGAQVIAASREWIMVGNRNMEVVEILSCANCGK